jgi:hypothetical protein
MGLMLSVCPASRSRPAQVEPLLQQMAVQQETDLAVAEAMRSLRLVGSTRPSASQLNVKTQGGSAAPGPGAPGAAPGGAGETGAGVSIGAAATIAATAVKASGGMDSGAMPGDPDAASLPADVAAKVQCRMCGSGLGGGGGGGSMCAGRGMQVGGLTSSEAESESCGTAGTTATGLTAMTTASSPGASLPQRLAVFATSSSGGFGNASVGGGLSSYGAFGAVERNTASGAFAGTGRDSGDAGSMPMVTTAGAGRGRGGGSAQPLCGGVVVEAGGDEPTAIDMMVG